MESLVERKADMVWLLKEVRSKAVLMLNPILHTHIVPQVIKAEAKRKKMDKEKDKAG